MKNNKLSLKKSTLKHLGKVNGGAINTTIVGTTQPSYYSCWVCQTDWSCPSDDTKCIKAPASFSCNGNCA